MNGLNKDHFRTNEMKKNWRGDSGAKSKATLFPYTTAKKEKEKQA